MVTILIPILGIIITNGLFSYVYERVINNLNEYWVYGLQKYWDTSNISEWSGHNIQWFIHL